MAKRRRKRVTAEDKQQIWKMAAEGMSCSAIARQLGRHDTVIRYHMKNNKALALVSKTQQALEQANSNPVTRSLAGLVDILSQPNPLGEIEEVRVRVKERRVKLVLRRELELTV
jgi:transposase-like protein